jgi:hypothetical protein
MPACCLGTFLKDALTESVRVSPHPSMYACTYTRPRYICTLYVMRAEQNLYLHTDDFCISPTHAFVGTFIET